MLELLNQKFWFSHKYKETQIDYVTQSSRHCLPDKTAALCIKNNCDRCTIIFATIRLGGATSPVWVIAAQSFFPLVADLVQKMNFKDFANFMIFLQTNMGLVTLIDVLKKLNLKLEAETEMRLQLEEKVDRQQQEPVPSLIRGLVLHIFTGS